MLKGECTLKEEVVGFTQKQRKWFLNRDGHQCQHHTYDPETGKWVRCPVTCGLQIHHIIPRGWAKEHLPKSFPVNGSTNGITLCAYHHVGKDSVHPDTYEAKMQYRAGDKQAYQKMRVARKAMNQAGQPYWSPIWDWMYNRIVRKLNLKHLRTEPYPKNGNRGHNGRVK